MAKVHLALTLFWIILAIPTILWWRESIFWVSIMSLYAIVSTHWSAFQAARADEHIKDFAKNSEKLK